MTSDKSNILYDTSSIYFLDDEKIDELKENDSKFDEDVNLITQMITSL